MGSMKNTGKFLPTQETCRLGRLCETPKRDGIVPAPSYPGIDRIEARFAGRAYSMHRHDTYALGVTMHGVQTFWYHGEVRYSMPGQLIVLHPDEPHDGAAGTAAGLRYRMLYLEPSLLRQALGTRPHELPFVQDPVMTDIPLQRALLAALGDMDVEIDELLADQLIADLADGLNRHASSSAGPGLRLASSRVQRARSYLDARALYPVRSTELESVSGLDRFTLARQFKALFGTSPHRYLMMRRLQQARRLLQTGRELADVAAATGFSDQSHFNRRFKQAFGMAPGKWRTLVRSRALSA